MNVKTSVFVICVEAIIYFLLYKLHDCTFKLHQSFSLFYVELQRTSFCNFLEKLPYVIFDYHRGVA